MTDGHKSEREVALKELQKLPGVGRSIAEDLWGLGIRSIGDLKDRDPEDLYRRLCEQTGMKVDRCVLYVFRCAVYYAANGTTRPELLKWWKWKDEARCRMIGLVGRNWN